jgi:hypothetical protein
MVPQYPQYSDILEQLETKPSNIEPKRLPEIIDQLKKLSDCAEQRVESCEKAIRLIHEQMRDIEAEHKERERQAEQTRRTQAKKEASQKNTKAKKRKERPESIEVDIKNEGKYTTSLSRSYDTLLSRLVTMAAFTAPLKSLRTNSPLQMNPSRSSSVAELAPQDPSTVHHRQKRPNLALALHLSRKSQTHLMRNHLPQESRLPQQTCQCQMRKKTELFTLPVKYRSKVSSQIR